MARRGVLRTTEAPRLARLIDRIEGARRLSEVTGVPAARRSLAEELIDEFVTVAAASSRGSSTGRPPAGRRAVERVRDALVAPSATTVADLARAAEVPGRTLRHVTREQFGVSPKRYLILRQLDAVRADLTAAGHDETVTSVGARNGVRELGRFAGRYRDVFGGCPSATLSRR